MVMGVALLANPESTVPVRWGFIRGPVAHCVKPDRSAVGLPGRRRSVASLRRRNGCGHWLWRRVSALSCGHLRRHNGLLRAGDRSQSTGPDYALKPLLSQCRACRDSSSTFVTNPQRRQCSWSIPSCLSRRHLWVVIAHHQRLRFMMAPFVSIRPTSWAAYSSEAVSACLCARRHTGRALEDEGCGKRDPDSWASCITRRWAVVACHFSARHNTARRRMVGGVRAAGFRDPGSAQRLMVAEPSSVGREAV